MSSPAAPALRPATPTRLTSLDAYRGFTMLAMVSSGLGLRTIAEQHPDSPIWKQIHYHLEHVDWVGCAAWDLIQPSFTFMVGVSMAFSYAARKAKGDSWGRMFFHALWRGLALTLLGVFLRSDHSSETRWTLEDVLSQIGLGYPLLFLLWGRSTKVQWAAVIAVLVGYWALFAAWPLPGPDFDYAANGAKDFLTGFAAHWNKNTNPAHFFDVWFLNLFPRTEPFKFNGGGYVTLSFIPSLATMIFGLIAGEYLRSDKSDRSKVIAFVVWGLIGLAAGEALNQLGVCPIVKRIWTPSWALFSTGWALVFLAFFYLVIDVAKLPYWAWPAVVVGMNSIAIYVVSHLADGWVLKTINIHTNYYVKKLTSGQADSIYLLLDKSIWPHAGSPIYEGMLRQITVVLVMWLMCFWMYRRKLFIRI